MCRERLRLLPPLRCRFPSYVRPAPGRERFRAGAAAPLSQALRSLVLPVVGREVLLLLPGGDAHDLDGVADYVGGALLAFRSLGHLLNPMSLAAASLNL